MSGVGALGGLGESQRSLGTSVVPKHITALCSRLLDKLLIKLMNDASQTGKPERITTY